MKIKKFLRRAGSLIQKAQCHYSGYELIAYWCGRLYIHKAKTYSDAIEWASMYPKGATVRIWRFGSLLGVRMCA